jgi:predicted transcriptional regulator
MTLGEIDAAMAQMRARRKALKSSSKVTQRKIITLARRRERLMQQVNALDEQIVQLREGRQAQPLPVPDQQRARRSQAQVTADLDAILACVQRHTVTKRATIIKECHLSPANASAYLRQLCQDGKLIRRGEKSATTYALP